MRDKQLAKCRPSTPLIVLATKRVVNRFYHGDFEDGRARIKKGCGAAEFVLTAIVAPGTFLE